MRSFDFISLSGFLLLFFFLVAQPVLGQYQDRALERARSVKMLSDDREAVRKIFHDFNLDDSEETSDEFSFGDTEVKVLYSSGKCSEEEEEEEVWDVPAGRVIKIGILEDGDWKLENLALALRDLEKEPMTAQSQSRFVYHSKKSGLAVEVDDDEIDAVIFFPSVDSKTKKCKSPFAKEFIEQKSWFGSNGPPKSEGCVHLTANVTQLDLSILEISALTAKQIDVTTTAVDPENDVLVYVYQASGGRIIGTGPKVKWDLTGVVPGSYTILAGVDDGCGLCGATMTKTVVVK